MEVRGAFLLGFGAMDGEGGGGKGREEEEEEEDRSKTLHFFFLIGGRLVGAGLLASDAYSLSLSLSPSLSLSHSLQIFAASGK